MTRQDIDLCPEARTGDVDNRYINTVERSPAHDTCYSHLFSNSCCNSCRICKASIGLSWLMSKLRTRSASPWFTGSNNLICMGAESSPGLNSSVTEYCLTS